MSEQIPKKTIAFVSGDAWTIYNYRLEVLQRLSEMGFQILVIAAKDEYAKLLEEMGFRFVPVTMNNRSLSPLHDLRFLRQLRKIYQTHRPDFIFHYQVKPVIYGTLAAASLQIPTVAIITGLGYAFQNKGLLKTLTIALYRLSLWRVTELWCLNEQDAAYFIREKLIPGPRVRILPGEGVNTRYFSRQQYPANPGKIFTFLLVSRLLKTKGIEEYAAAAKILRLRNHEINCVLIGGQGDHPDAIEPQKIKAWKDDKSLDYLGFVKDVRNAFADADCFVYPSYYNEGVPRSLLEACSMELPVITTNNPGCRELLMDGANGLLCKKQDAEDLADQMEKILWLDKSARRAMGMRGRAMVSSRYSMDLIVQIYSRFLQDFFLRRTTVSDAVGLQINPGKVD